jgi:hypothetical protein
LGAREAVERLKVGHGCLEKSNGPLQERALLISG